MGELSGFLPHSFRPNSSMLSLLFLALCAFTIVGCSAHHEGRKAWDPAGADRAWAKAGVISVSDDQRLRLINNEVLRDHALDDNAVDWLIAAMHHSSTAPFVFQIRAMGVFGCMTAMTPSQRQKIRGAVTPLLTQEYPGDNLHVCRKEARELLEHLNRLARAGAG